LINQIITPYLELQLSLRFNEQYIVSLEK